jgi:hypothetical protein
VYPTVKQLNTQVQELLAQWKITCDSLVEFVRPLLPTETLVLVGSVADGLANPLSDIDLVLIGEKGLNQGLILREAECEAGVRQLQGHEVHVECWRYLDLRCIGDKIRRTLAEARRSPIIDDSQRLSKIQLRLIHRLRNGIILANPQNEESWSQCLELSEGPEYLVRHWLNEFYSLRSDALGQLRHGDAATASYTLRLTMSALAGAWLGSWGITNTYAKWRPLLLQRNCELLGADKTNRLLQYLFVTVSDSDRSTGDEALCFADSVIDAIGARHSELRAWLCPLAPKPAACVPTG